MNVWDIIYLVGMPLSYFSSLMATRRIIILRSARGHAVSAYALSWCLMLSSFLRAWLSLGDFIFSLNAAIFLVINGIQLILIIKWRTQ